MRKITLQLLALSGMFGRPYFNDVKFKEPIPKEPESPELQAYLISKTNLRRQRIRERNLKLLASGGFKSMRDKP